MEHLLLCVALLTGIALVSLDLSSMQFRIVGFRRSRLVLGLRYRLEVCFLVITDLQQIIQYRFRSLKSSCFRLAVMCLRQVSLRSRLIPRYFTSSAWGRWSLFNLTVGHVILLRVKVTCTDFASFAFILHVFFTIKSEMCVLWAEHKNPQIYKQRIYFMTDHHTHTYTTLMHRGRHSVLMKLTIIMKKVWTQKFYVGGRKILKIFLYILHQQIPAHVVLFPAKLYNSY